MTKHSLSLCMIVKDEEETVGRAIKSALAVVDEVVVVDTGSTDNTRLIVEGYGARVIDFPWSDDFSAARNAGLAAAYGDWILILDADEVLESIRPVEMGRLLSDEEAIAYYARIRNEVPGRPATVYDKVRIFRNHPDIRYRYPIHEQITPAIAECATRVGGEFKPSRLSILHYGSAEREDTGKRTRNQRLLGRAIEDHPGEPYFRYQLACEMASYLEESVLAVKGFGQMLRELERSASLVADMPVDRSQHLGYGPDLFSRTAAALLTAGRIDDAVELVETANGIYGETSLLRFSRGTTLWHRSRRDNDAAARGQAVEAMSAMLQGSPDLEPAPVSSAYFELYPLRYLGLAALDEGSLDEARGWFQKALEVDPDYSGALCGLAQVAEAEGRHREALQIHLRAISVNEAEVEAWLGGAEVLRTLGFADNAVSWLQKLQTFLTEDPRVAALLEELHAERRGELVGQS